jgi:hypothetical protein
MGVAAHLYAGSTWFRKNRSKLFEIVLRSSTASYLALASGAFANDSSALLDRVAANPLLVLELAQSPMLKDQLRDAWFTEALIPRPLFHSLYLFMKNKERAAWELLRQTADDDAVAAGICLGLDPQSKNATTWSRVVGNSSEAMYWSGRIWQEEHDDIWKFPYAQDAMTHLTKDPAWYYHFLRDLEWADINAKVTEMWPDPWAVELIVDRRLSKDLVTFLCSKRDLDPKHHVESALLLWASDYVDNSL